MSSSDLNIQVPGPELRAKTPGSIERNLSCVVGVGGACPSAWHRAPGLPDFLVLFPHGQPENHRALLLPWRRFGAAFQKQGFCQLRDAGRNMNYTNKHLTLGSKAGGQGTHCHA